MTPRRELALTGIVSAVALALVFAAALGAIPSGLLPHAPAWALAAIPTVNALVSLLALGTIATGWRRIRRGDVAGHRRMMLTSLALFATFLVLYLYKVALEGPTAFTGPAVLRQYVFLPLLVVHVSLAVVAVPLLVYVLVLARSRPVADLPASPHPRVGRVAATLWLVSFALGILVYVLLYLV
ncbi:MAG: DUF420 domain-containing protein [Halanaeroarchaeum sp.]